jgi:Gpi18-like mannosyltransferase
MSRSSIARFGPRWAPVVLLLAAALALRALIAWVWWPESGFFLDLELNVEWVRVLTEGGWGGFYRPDAPYFIDYPPAYFVVLSAAGWLSDVWVGASGGESIVLPLLKLPPILADVGTAGILATIASRVIGPSAAVPAAALFAFNPAVILDSAVYGQNDSVGALLVVLAILALLRGRTELAAGLSVLATLVKFQFGFLIPIVLVVGLRRHLGPNGERFRVLTSAAAAVATMLVVLWPFGLSLYDPSVPARSLWHRFTAASEAFPGITQNAFNLWMNPFFDVLRPDASGATAGRVVDDSRALLSLGPIELTWQLLGGVLFAAALGLALRLVARRDDSVAILVAAFVVAAALYMFPTRIHERYLVPALAVGAPLALTRLRGWRIGYAVLSAVAFFAIYFVYTLPNLNRHMPRDAFLNATLLSPWGIYLISLCGLIATGWMLWRAHRMAVDPPSEPVSTEGRIAAPVRPAAAALRRVGPGTGPRWVTVLVMVAVSLGAAIVSARVSFGVDGWLWSLDLPKIHYPLASFYHEALVEGRLPLWSDRLGMGYPLYAEGQIGAFYPPNWLIFQLEPLAAMDLTRLAHLTLAGIGAGLLALRVAGTRPGALVAILVTVLGGAITTKLEWWNLVAAYGWLPWVLLPLAGRAAPSRVALVTAGVLWGVQALCGHPNTWLLTGLAATILILRRPMGRSLARVAGFGIIGGSVGAAQLIPTLLLQAVSARSLGLSANDLFTSASTPFDVIGLGFANAFVRAGGDGSWDFASTWYPDGIFALLEAGAYVGLPSVALAGLGIATRRSRRWIAIGVVAVAIGVVAAFRPEWWQAVPILNGLRSPVRSYLLLTLVIAILAALGMSRLGREPSAGRRGLVAMAIVIGAYVLAAVVARSFPSVFQWLLVLSAPGMDIEGARANHERAVAALTSLWPLALELVAAAGFGLLLLVRRRAEGVAAAVLVVALPLVLLSPRANPLRPGSDLDYAASPFVSAVVAQAPRRVLTISPPGYYSGMPDQLAAAGVADVDMFSSLNLLANDALVRELREADPDGDLRRAIGVDLVVTFDAPCPGTQVAEVPDQAARLCRVDGTLAPPYWIPRDAVVGDRPDPARAVATHRDVSVVERRLQDLELTVDQPEAGWVYVDRAAWLGWRATLDGTVVASRSAMGGQLIEVPAGRHVVSLSLAPWDALIGVALGLAVLVVAAGWAWQGRRPDRSGEPVHGGGPHAPRVDDEADGQGDRRLEPDHAPDAVRSQHEQERVEVLRVAVAELRPSRVRVEEHRHQDGDDRRPAADHEPGR